MKTLLILIFSFFSLCSYGQHIISFSFADNDFNIGGRYDHQFPKVPKLGFYLTGGLGHYNSVETGKWEHVRAATGVVRYVQNYAMDEFLTYYSIGVNGNFYEQETRGLKKPTKYMLRPFSFEFGTGFVVAERLVVGWTFDPLKNDVILNIGYRFGKTR